MKRGFMTIFKSGLFAVLMISLSAVAQEAAPQASPGTQTAEVASSAAPSNTSAQPATEKQPDVSATPATTMDDVVNRAILREHALMDFLKRRTPLVETYLQD